MFTGIIEALGKVVRTEPLGSGKRLWIDAPFCSELKIDQSVAHNGVCLTVVELAGNQYALDVIDETLKRSNISQLQQGDLINLERCMLPTQRVDGHFVQGHVDTTGVVRHIEDVDGSWEVTIGYDATQYGHLVVEKGSIALNGISLTVAEDLPDGLKVCIIPYTWSHTNLHTLSAGDLINIEFDIMGKYLQKYMAAYAKP